MAELTANPEAPKRSRRRNSPNADLTVREAGRMGGEKRARQLGSQGYSALGQKGGGVTRDRYGSQHYAALGRAGAASRAREANDMSLPDRRPERTSGAGKE